MALCCRTDGLASRRTQPPCTLTHSSPSHARGAPLAASARCTSPRVHLPPGKMPTHSRWASLSCLCAASISFPLKIEDALPARLTTNTRDGPHAFKPPCTTCSVETYKPMRWLRCCQRLQTRLLGQSRQPGKRNDGSGLPFLRKARLLDCACRVRSCFGPFLRPIHSCGDRGRSQLRAPTVKKTTRPGTSVVLCPPSGLRTRLRRPGAVTKTRPTLSAAPPTELRAADGMPSRD